MKKLFSKRRIFLLLIISFCLVGCGKREQYIPELLEPVNAGTSWRKVTRGDIFSGTTYDGYVEPEVTKCHFETTGLLETLQVHIGDSVSEGQILATLNVGDREEQIEDAQSEKQYITERYLLEKRAVELAIKSGEVELEKLKLKKDQRGISIKEVQLEKLRLNLEYKRVQAELSLARKDREIELCQEDMKSNILRAPISGKVVSTGGFLPGDTMKKSSVVVYIANPGTYKIVTRQGLESDYKFAKGLFTYFDGQEIALELIPRTSKEVRMAKEEEYNLTHIFDAACNLSDKAYGTYAPIIATDVDVRNVLTVPIGAVFNDGDVDYVYINSEGEKEYREVEVGVKKSGKAEIISGLEEGDEVYVKE